MANRSPNLRKLSKGYEDMPYLYWWDITPTFAEGLSDSDTVEFFCKDTKEWCVVTAKELKPFLTPDRQTSRGEGHWGIKVLRNRTDELAFEPPSGSDKWLFLPVIWINEQKED